MSVKKISLTKIKTAWMAQLPLQEKKKNSLTKPLCKRPKATRINAAASEITQNRDNQHFQKCSLAKGKLLS